MVLVPLAFLALLLRVAHVRAGRMDDVDVDVDVGDVATGAERAKVDPEDP